MAWSFDETNDDVQVTDNARLTLPNGDWTLGGWLKIPDNTGTLYQYFLSWGTLNTDPSINLFFQEASSPSPNLIGWNINGGGTINSNGTYGTSTDWQHCLWQRSGTTVTLYVNASADATTKTLSAGVNVAGNTFFGARSDLNADRYYGGLMAEWFKVDRAISANEITALARGCSPINLTGIFDSTSWYVDMELGGATGIYRELIGNLTVTNTGSTHGNHAPIELEFDGSMPLAAAAGGLAALIGAGFGGQQYIIGG